MKAGVENGKMPEMSTGKKIQYVAGLVVGGAIALPLGAIGVVAGAALGAAKFVATTSWNCFCCLACCACCGIFKKCMVLDEEGNAKSNLSAMPVDAIVYGYKGALVGMKAGFALSGMKQDCKDIIRNKYEENPNSIIYGILNEIFSPNETLSKNPDRQINGNLTSSRRSSESSSVVSYDVNTNDLGGSTAARRINSSISSEISVDEANWKGASQTQPRYVGNPNFTPNAGRQ